MTVLHRLVCLSSPAEDFTNSDLEFLVSDTSAAHENSGLTGFFLTCDCHYLQVVEGEAAHVSQALERIRSDGRHVGTIVLESRRVSSRRFPQWTLGYLNEDTLSPTQRAIYRDLVDAAHGRQPTKLTRTAPISSIVERFISEFSTSRAA